MAYEHSRKPLCQSCAHRLSPDPRGAATLFASEKSASFHLAPVGSLRAADVLPGPQLQRHGRVAVGHGSGSPGVGTAQSPRSHHLAAHLQEVAHGGL